MSKPAIYRYTAAVLLLLMSIALAFGGMQLWRGGPGIWPDVVASESTVLGIASGMLVLALLLLIAAGAATRNLAWTIYAAAMTLSLFVIAALWANRALFGDIRPMHIGTNAVVSAAILLLLRAGCVRGAGRMSRASKEASRPANLGS